MGLQEAPHGERVLAVALHPQMQCFEPLQEQKRVEGTHRRSQIAQKLRKNAGLPDKVTGIVAEDRESRIHKAVEAIKPGD